MNITLEQERYFISEDKLETFRGIKSVLSLNSFNVANIPNLKENIEDSFFFLKTKSPEIFSDKESLDEKAFEDLVILIAEIKPEIIVIDYKVYGMSFLQNLIESLYEYRSIDSDTDEITIIFENTIGSNFKIGKAREAMNIALAVNYTKFLGDCPPNDMTPEQLTLEVKHMVQDNRKIKTHIYTESALEKMGANAFLSVSKGSAEQGYIIVIEYNLKGDEEALGFVGKGVTFDSGGISLKGANNMHHMKHDMQGASTILGAMAALIANDEDVSVVAILGCTENMPSSNATKPGDVVTSLSGQTIEVLNTDAEGRMVLADCLTLMQNNYPQVKDIIDVATLTGSTAATFGNVYSAAFSNDVEFSEWVKKTASEQNELIHIMPLHEDYEKTLESNVADMSNLGKGAGAITAAMFLQKFINEGINWVHLDIAGTGFDDGKATGRMVSTFIEMAEYYR